MYNSGCCAMSTYMKMKSYDQILTKEEHVEKKNCRNTLREGDPDFIINSLDELNPLIDMINYDIIY